MSEENTDRIPEARGAVLREILAELEAKIAQDLAEREEDVDQLSQLIENISGAITDRSESIDYKEADAIAREIVQGKVYCLRAYADRVVVVPEAE